MIDGRGVFNRMSRNLIRDCFAFALLESLCDWSWIHAHFFTQSEAKVKPITNWSFSFSREFYLEFSLALESIFNSSDYFGLRRNALNEWSTDWLKGWKSDGINKWTSERLKDVIEWQSHWVTDHEWLVMNDWRTRWLIINNWMTDRPTDWGKNLMTVLID